MRNAKGGRRRKAPPNTEWHGDILYGRKRIKGKLKRWSLRTGDVEIGRERVKEDIARLMAQTYYGDDRVLWTDAVASWAETHITHEVGASTATRYAVSLRQMEPWLIEKYVDEVDKELVKNIVLGRRAAGVTTATIRRDLSAGSSVMEFLETDENPFLARLKRLKERRDPIVLPELEHVQRIVQRASGRIPALTEAAVKTGCRQAELVTALRSRLDHPRRQLTVVGKGNKLRVIDVDYEGAYELLRAIPAKLGCRWLFWHGQGDPYRNLSSNFAALVRAEFVRAYDAFHGTDAKTRPNVDELLEQEGGPDWPDIGFRTFTFHDLRHLHAVRWLKSGRSIYDLKERLGHASIKTTEIYLKFLTPEEARIAKFGLRPAEIDTKAVTA
ncbi:tyrosine-type recombinase/integrase [Bradyrhizobium sp.]|uniref:tyrosine-type recombinase/integrase n=1 Tax=Bradyrhizobium sp. TaxID=376 RepID=UPI0039E38764